MSHDPYSLTPTSDPWSLFAASPTTLQSLATMPSPTTTANKTATAPAMPSPGAVSGSNAFSPQHLTFAPSKPVEKYLGVYPNGSLWRGVVKAMPGGKPWYDKGHATPREAAFARDAYIKANLGAWTKMPKLDPKVQVVIDVA